MDNPDRNCGIEIPAFFRARGVTAQPLADFVGTLWYWRGYSLPKAKERILPWGTVELVINLNDRPLDYSVISGPHSRAFLIDRVPEDELVGIHFKPGGAFPFLSSPYDDFLNRNICTADVWGQSVIDRLISRVKEANTVDDKLDCVQAWLSEIAVRPIEHHPAIRPALRAFSAAPNFWSSQLLAAASNISQRRFIERFRDEVGLTPKLFCRIRRFHMVIQGIGQRKDVDWSDLALASGYYDQSHFNHEFREFSGLTPVEYLEQRIPDHLGHVRATAS